MTGRRLAIALLFVIVAVVLQTTLFVTDRGRPFGAAPDLVVLAVLVGVRALDAELGIFLGFTAGLLADLLGGLPIGMWAFSFTTVAYIIVRLRDRVEDAPAMKAGGIFVLALVSQVLYVLLGSLFGQQPLRDPGAIRRVLLTSIFTLIVGLAVVPLGSWVMRAGRFRRRRVVL